MELIWFDNDRKQWTTMIKDRQKRVPMFCDTSEGLRDYLEARNHGGNHLSWHYKFDTEFNRAQLYGYNGEELNTLIRVNHFLDRFKINQYWKRRNRGMQKRRKDDLAENARDIRAPNN